MRAIAIIFDYFRYFDIFADYADYFDYFISMPLRRFTLSLLAPLIIFFRHYAISPMPYFHFSMPPFSYAAAITPPLFRHYAYYCRFRFLITPFIFISFRRY
jgi:hypothetical protein